MGAFLSIFFALKARSARDEVFRFRDNARDKHGVSNASSFLNDAKRVRTQFEKYCAPLSSGVLSGIDTDRDSTELNSLVSMLNDRVAVLSRVMSHDAKVFYTECSELLDEFNRASGIESKATQGVKIKRKLDVLISQLAAAIEDHSWRVNQ